MASKPPLPPMSHSAAYYDNQSNIKQANLTYTPNLLPSQPPAAHLQSNSQHTVSSPRTGLPRAPSSPSSNASSSSTSDGDIYLAKNQYHFAPRAEEGVVGKKVSRQAHYASHGGTMPRAGSRTHSEYLEDNSTVLRYVQSDVDDENEGHDHALWILVWMSFLDPFHCIFSAMYTIFALLAFTFLFPLRLCRGECSPSTTFVRMVAPVFRDHLQLIYAKSLSDAHMFEFSPVCLVLIHLASPIISMGNAIAAWVVAIFWLFALIMGNPDGTERRDDGRATVLMLRDWWERCLLYAIRK
ncbi:hypothetical protein PV11_06129 [Exophiala sideris]|uniref:Uncharacterized protein n=1 Tax=Exophiala sideris TaxID=1016849 RepID=A0A0D1YRX0_9EURO|nr:hypothetical protein PV11_06129 [Exophiala sideris]